MTEKRTNRQYTQEFKEEAVALVTGQGYSVPQAAKAVEVNPNLLYKWKDKLEAEQRDTSLSADERKELDRLCKENRELKMEKDILKKASIFFAKEAK